MDATGKTATEVHNMGRWDRALTALLRGRFYKERNGDANQNPKP